LNAIAKSCSELPLSTRWTRAETYQNIGYIWIHGLSMSDTDTQRRIVMYPTT